MRSTNVRNISRPLILLSAVTVVLTTVAATNLALIYLLFVVDHSGSDLAGFLPIMDEGAFVFDVGAARGGAGGRSALRAATCRRD